MNINKLSQTYSPKLVKVMLKTGLLCLLSLTTSLVSADDTEVFYTTSEVNNNVMFIMDNSGSMTREVDGTVASGDPITISSRIINKNEDADEHQAPATPRVSRTGKVLELTKDHDKTQIVGLRFRRLGIPAGATIESAYIQFTANASGSAPTNLSIRTQDSNNRRVFQENNKNISNRSLYNETVTWNNVPSWSYNQRGPAQKTPDIKSLVQLLVDRSNWVPNAPIVFVISGSGDRRPKSRDNGDGSGAPELIVTYKVTNGQKTRMQVMQDALRTVLDNAPDNLSVGIMNYGDNVPYRDSDLPNGVKFPVTPVTSLARPIVEASMELNGTTRWDYSNIPEPNDTVTVRHYLSDIADDWNPKGVTPIVDALYEASQYFRGAPVDYGFEKARKERKWGAHPSTYVGEPITQTSTIQACGRTQDKWVYNNDIAQWDAGNQSEICPADRFFPTGPGTTANCVLTKHSCSNYSYRPCTSYAPSYTTCTGTDENGNQTGCTTTGGQCLTRGPTVSGSQCAYSKCKDKYVSLPAPNYTTPMKDGCQSSFMILMSDGKPEYEGSNGTARNPQSYYKIRTILGEDGGDDSCPIAEYQSGRCGPELTEHLATTDNSDNLDGKQVIHTYVIGFAEGIDADASSYLQSLVTLKDDPDTVEKEGYFSATNEAELANAFAKALDEIAQEARSQASPGYSVNVKSGLEHEDDIYIPVFDKSSSSVWSGNLKKFKIVNTGTDRNIRGKADVTGNDPLIDAMSELGVFKDEAWDLFSKSAIPDGKVVEKGGTASLLNDQQDDPTNVAPRRKLYSNISGSNLSDPVNHIVPTNAAITTEPEFLDYDETALGLNPAEAIIYRTKVINFIRGWQGGNKNITPPYGVQRKHMGDMLHSEPVIFTYTQSDSTGAGKKQYIFAATNEGYLHAFDSITGEEKFAFMPKELLKNIQPQFTGQGPHLYGIDGRISYWHDDKNNDKNVNGADKVYLFFGMRRGGRSYYALDVTNIDAPKLMWVADNNSLGLNRLGQSWSMPYLAKVKKGDVEKEVVVVTAGNDPVLDYAEDNYNLLTDRPAHSMGDDIFILDLHTGTKLWSMKDVIGDYVTHGIPGGVRILDVNRNGLLDRMYFGDTGGNVWRLDMSETLSLDHNEYNLTKLANVGGSRKFYNEPDVAQLRANGKTKYTISIGSGHRPHPMDKTINDHMFVLIDDSPLDPLPDDFDTIEFSDLSEVAITTVGTGDTITKNVTKSSDFEGKKITDVIDVDGNRKRGWYVDFSEDGEKVLAQSITFEGSLLFTTLVPEVLNQGQPVNSCAAPATQGRIYALNILTGEASMDLSKTNGINDDDAFLPVSKNEILDTPQPVFDKIRCPVGEECKHEVDIRIGKKSTQVSNENVADIESIYWSDPSN